MLNRLANVNDTLLDVKIGKDSITWDNEFADTSDTKHDGYLSYTSDGMKCILFPENGFFKRSNEATVLPHAIGCQTPTDNSHYKVKLQGSY